MPSVRLLLRFSPWLFLAAFGAAQASSLCYDDRDYPAVASVAPTPSGYRIVLSGTARGGSDTAPVLEFSSGWRAAGRVPCAQGRCVDETRGCAVRLAAGSGVHRSPRTGESVDCA